MKELARKGGDCSGREWKGEWNGGEAMRVPYKVACRHPWLGWADILLY